MALNYDIRREKHAIGEFSAIINFAGGVSASTFSMVLAALKPVAKNLDLPAPINIQTVNIAFGGPAGAQSQPVSGAGFQRFATTGEIACALVCDANSITFTLREYERWHDILPLLTEQIGSIAAAYASEVPAIRSFLLQYQNEFRANSPHVWNTDELFKQDSRWLAPIAKSSEQPWHCHVGTFSEANGSFRSLVNVNFDVSPHVFLAGEAPRNYVRVLVLASNQYDVPTVGALVVSPDNIASEIERNFNLAHALEKKVLNEIMSDAYIAIMGEGADEH